MSKSDRLHITIVSPERTLLDTFAERVFVPGEKGRFEILKNHAHIISSLSAGVVICEGDNSFQLNIAAGFIEVSDNKVTLCIEEA